MPHSGGPAGGGDVRDARLSDELRRALWEWAEVADAVVAAGDDRELDLLRRRGRQLASRMADTLGHPVRFVDPVSGAVESIRAGRDGADHLVPTPDDARPALAPDPPDPTPWGTGTTVAAFFAVLAALADVALAQAVAGAFGLLWVPANLLVTAGTAPALWLARAVPFWRWPALGTAAGLAAAWIVLLLGLLAP